MKHEKDNLLIINVFFKVLIHYLHAVFRNIIILKQGHDLHEMEIIET